MTEYNKLVRDRIPEIIENSGSRYSIRTLDEEEFGKCIKAKLVEEAKEYEESGEIEELADIFEVIGYILDINGWTYDEVYQKALEKLKKRGGFDKRIFLEWTD